MKHSSEICRFSLSGFLWFGFCCVAIAAAPTKESFATQVVIRASERWTRVVNEVDIEPGSALDFTTFAGPREPAGTYGRVVARGDHFEFEKRPGVPVRFYGVNLCLSANYLEPADAEKFVENLVRRGYNALRIHHHDGGLVGNRHDSVTPDPAQFARLDALMAACVKRGVYVTTDLYVSRKMSYRALGINKPGSAKGWPFKELLLFHEGTRSNYFAFARNFLSHRNPLTGRTYAEEPALAWLALVNEGNSGHHGAGYFREFPEGAAEWRAWLAKRKVEDPAHFAKVPEALPDNTWSRTRVHNSAFSLFVTDLEIAFDARVKRFLRDEMGCQALVTSINGGCSPPCYQLARAANYDYVDNHFYVDTPKFLGRRWMLPSRQNNGIAFVTAQRKGSDLGVKGNVCQRLLDRPFTVTEYNFAGPNEHRGISGLMTGALAARQDWGGVWRFAWSHGAPGITNSAQALCGRFDLCGDIANRAAERAAISLFLRGDMAPATRTIPWILPERKMRAVTRFSPYEPPSWLGAAWWFRLGTLVADAAPASAWKSVMYADAYQTTRTDLIGELAQQDAGVRIDVDRKAFAVTTPRTCGVFAPEGRYTAGDLTVDFGADEATVWATSLDGKPLSKSGHILVSHVTDVKNSGIAYADKDRTTLIGRGELPLLMRVGKAQVSLKVAAGNWQVYRLAMTGRRLESLPVKFASDELSFEATTKDASIHYELRIN